MSNYTKATDFATKDGLLTGNPAKIIKGAEIDDEFNAIAVAVSTKADLASPTFTGTPAAPTAAPGTNTTQLATTAFTTAAITAATGSLGTISTQDANNVSITGGSITGITDLAVADGGTGASSFTANNVLLGNGTSAFQTVAPGTSGNVLTSNGTTWSSAAIPAQSTAQVLNATAGAALNDVGSYAFLMRYEATSTTVDANVAATNLYYSNIRQDDDDSGVESGRIVSSPRPSGTWKLMGGGSYSTNRFTTSLWLRVA